MSRRNQLRLAISWVMGTTRSIMRRKRNKNVCDFCLTLHRMKRKIGSTRIMRSNWWQHVLIIFSIIFFSQGLEPTWMMRVRVTSTESNELFIYWSHERWYQQRSGTIDLYIFMFDKFDKHNSSFINIHGWPRPRCAVATYIRHSDISFFFFLCDSTPAGLTPFLFSLCALPTVSITWINNL